MGGERLATVDQGALLAESLGDRGILRTLLAGGREKEAISQLVVSRLEHDPIGQTSFLRTLFENLANEGKLEITNRRDAALAILTEVSGDEVHLTKVMTPLVIANSTVVCDAYIDAVQQQTGESDIFSAIDALLQVGKAIAPHLPQTAKARQQISKAWTQVARERSETDEQKHIRLELAKIKLSMFYYSGDSDVEELIQQGFTYFQIKEQLGREESSIRASASRLIDAGRIERRTRGGHPKEDPKEERKVGRPVSQATIQLDNNVEQLRNQNPGLSGIQIAEELGVESWQVMASFTRLIAAGRIEGRKKQWSKEILATSLHVNRYLVK